MSGKVNDRLYYVHLHNRRRLRLIADLQSGINSVAFLSSQRIGIFPGASLKCVARNHYAAVALRDVFQRGFLSFGFSVKVLVAIQKAPAGSTIQVFLDGRDHPKDLQPTWLGHSSG